MQYPISLPSPKLATATVTKSPNIKVQKYDLGSKITRTEQNTDEYGFSVVFTGEEFDTFLEWFENDIDSGKDIFTANWDYLDENTTKNYEFTTRISYTTLSDNLYNISASIRGE